MIAVHPMSWSMLNKDTTYEPYVPSDKRLDINEGFFSLKPIIPVRARINVPIKCPAKITAMPVLIPRGAIKLPVIISARETAAPNHSAKKLKLPVLLSLVN
jgi:hypothetical protein